MDRRMFLKMSAGGILLPVVGGIFPPAGELYERGSIAIEADALGPRGYVLRTHRWETSRDDWEVGSGWVRYSKPLLMDAILNCTVIGTRVMAPDEWGGPRLKGGFTSGPKYLLTGDKLQIREILLTTL